MSYQAPKDEILQRLCCSSDIELSQAFENCSGREVYSESLRSLVRDLAEEHQLRERNTLIARLQSWITEGQNGKGANNRFLRRVKDLKLLPFGSSVMGISHREGDLDISLEGTVLDQSISPTGRLSDALRGFKGDLLSEVHDILKRGQHFRYSKHTQLIRHAKVPVSKFVEPHTGIHCDLSIGNTTGVFKSVLLAEVLKIDDRVRDLVVIVKKWAKANHINDPANGSFNSYCLTLLVLSFAQARSPPLIPSFRELFPGLRDVVCESQKDGQVDLLAEIETFRQKALDWKKTFEEEGTKNKESLCELLTAFFLSFSLFSTHSQLLHYTAEGVSKSNSRPTSSCWESGFVLSAWDANALKRYQLFVEDPFEAKDNCARTLATQDWWRIVKTLQETVNLFQEFVYASPTAQPEKWHVIWSFLFQYEPLPPLPERPAFSVVDFPPQKPKALMPLHKECLVEHLNRFKASDKKFIAVSYSWWSKEFKQFVMSTIDALELFQGKGPKKKIIISKTNNIKKDMVEHAVNSTLRARKTHSQVVDPYSCIIKQRLAEFLRCAIRFHKFRASYFDERTKEWLMQCVLEAGLKGKYVDGDLQLERPADLRPMILLENANELANNPKRDLPLTTGLPTTDDLNIVGPLELDEPSPLLNTVVDPTPVKEEISPDDEEEEIEEELWFEGTENETGISSCGEVGTSYEAASYRNRYYTTIPSTHHHSVAESIKLNFDINEEEERCKVNFLVITRPIRRSNMRPKNHQEVEYKSSYFPSSESIKVSFNLVDDYVDVSLNVYYGMLGTSRGLLAELGTVDEETRDGLALDIEEQGEVQTSKEDLTTTSGLIRKGPTPEDLETTNHCLQQQQNSTSLLTSGLHNRNAEILRLVFLDLFDAMEKLQDTDSFRGEIEIDPTEYVVPVSWVRQQVRDIARHLVLEIVVPNKRKRPMKIRIRKRARFEESDSDDDYEFGRNAPSSSYNRDSRINHQLHDHYYYDDRKLQRRDLFDKFQRFPPRMIDEEDHVTKCLLWIKGMKREKSMHFQYGIYPQDVMLCLRERAEELGLTLEVRDNTMYIGINPHSTDHHYEEGGKISPTRLMCLNEKVQTSIREYFSSLMMESRSRGLERFSVPTKGYFMRPEWVAKQVVEIGRAFGFEAMERDGTVELFTFHQPAPPPPPQKPPIGQGLARYFSMPSPSATPFTIPMQSTAAGSPHVQPAHLSRSRSVNHYSAKSNQEGVKKVSCFSGFKMPGASNQGGHVIESRSLEEESKGTRNSNRKNGSPPDGNLAMLWNRSNSFTSGGNNNNGNINNHKSNSNSSRRQRSDNQNANNRQQQQQQQLSRPSPKNGGNHLTTGTQIWRKNSDNKGNGNGGFPGGRNSRSRSKTRRGRNRGGRNATAASNQNNEEQQQQQQQQQVSGMNGTKTSSITTTASTTTSQS